MNENEKILSLIQKLMTNRKLGDFLKTYDYSLNLYGLRISDSRHYFIRISHPQTENILWLQEEYIPKKDEKGQWIEYPTMENARVERIEPALTYIPMDLTYAEFSSNLLQFLEQLKSYQGNHLTLKSSDQLLQDLEELIHEVKSLL
ncbi:hypothetical protein SAMN05421877_10659 [Sphingobacterium lactis]|uniref:Uncharacterized protein n=2 Tax=Sphingobacterium lactis TaxID=797291 RepID=A0A1H5YP57_9SPHI|nr:hypothetical protein [Sphingobacterium lactis]SEG25267.1 hypothetical protein SAMN05421877_10659 [Sphingobacterium lactis]